MGIKKLAHKFKKRILEKAKIKDGTSADNIKLGEMGSWAELFGSCEWVIPELDNIKVKGTCAGHCEGCFNPSHPEKSPCYVTNSYRMYTKRNEDGTVGNIVTNECSVKLGHAYRTLAMTMYRDELLVRLDSQLTMKRKRFEVIRINESGELTCKDDYYLWAELARRHPETTFYLYTKNYDVVSKVDIPKNLYINISVWHESGVKEYLELKDNPQIRAFVLIDDKYTIEKYKELGLEVTSMCPAYDSNGKMNHEVTCDKCKKCYSQRDRCCGCYEH